MLTDIRANAKRMARDNYAMLRPAGSRFWEELSVTEQDIITGCVLAGMAHRDRTAEREAARKAWDAAAERRYGPGWPVHSSSDIARDAYLAAEFDAGERVTEPKAAPVLTWHEVGLFKWGLADETGLIVGRADDCTGYVRGECIGRYVTREQCRDAVKRLAEQRGAER